MKNIFRLALVATLFFFISACENTELDLLNNPNEVTPENAELDLLYNNVMLSFRNFVVNASGELQPYVRLIALGGGDIYRNADSPNSFDNEWSGAYAGVLPDLNLIISLAQESGQNVHGGSAKIMKAYVLFTLVDMFGDVPYSESGKGVEFPNPKVDPGADVYAAAIALLDEAIKDLQTQGARPTNDLFYGGDVVKWRKLANTLKLRAYLQTRLVNTNAKAQIDAIIASGEYISATADDFQFPYSSNRANPDSRHPNYAAGYETGGPAYQSNYFMWSMFGEKDVVDPRIRFYFYRQDGNINDEDFFTLDCRGAPKPPHFPEWMPHCTASEDGYWGRDHGNDDGIPPDNLKRTAWGVYPAGGKFDDDSFKGIGNSGTDGARGAGIQPIVLGAWVDFMRAEAALTLGTAGDPRALLEAAIRKHIAKVISFSKGLLSIPAAFEPTQANIDAYVTEVLRLYDEAPTNDAKLNIIIKEYHISLFTMGIDAYNTYRRTGKPANMQPMRDPNPGDFPRSMWYPSNFVNLNAAADQKELTKQVFWDTNPPGFIK
ncbi:MAG: SusD/RagB family nutrient-binding outer membrane lipoprotein [Saprospiraceae bacterium]|nr:SusD/RagB family nutrient-binding outer membrane lipoprotein [Saprospiraceae bacterium]